MRYCSQDCQKQNWNDHKATCKRAVAFNANVATSVAQQKIYEAEMSQIRQETIDYKLDNGKCSVPNCSDQRCNEGMYLQIPPDTRMTREAFKGIATVCTACSPGWLCVKIDRVTRAASKCEHAINM
jgi:hypothetical protein